MIGEQSPFRSLAVLLALWAAASTQPAAGQFVPGRLCSSPHVYNTEREIDQLVEVLPEH